MPTPYAEYVGDRDPVDVLRMSLEEYRALVPRLTPERWTQPWAPGKWTARQIVLHVAQWELIFGVRVRCAVAVPGYVVQPLDQDPFMDVEGPLVDGPTAAAAFAAVRAMHVALASGLSLGQRAIKVRHPQRGEIDVADLLVTLAGHAVHHYRQLEPLVK